MKLRDLLLEAVRSAEERRFEAAWKKPGKAFSVDFNDVNNSAGSITIPKSISLQKALDTNLAKIIKLNHLPGVKKADQDTAVNPFIDAFKAGKISIKFYLQDESTEVLTYADTAKYTVVSDKDAEVISGTAGLVMLTTEFENSVKERKSL